MIAQICVLPSITISDHGASNDALRDDAKARVAQLVEQRIENPRVGGSSPPPGTTFSLIKQLFTIASHLNVISYDSTDSGCFVKLRVTEV